jgi:hypothetical protein
MKNRRQPQQVPVSLELPVELTPVIGHMEQPGAPNRERIRERSNDASSVPQLGDSIRSMPSSCRSMNRCNICRVR